MPSNEPSVHPAKGDAGTDRSAAIKALELEWVKKNRQAAQADPEKSDDDSGPGENN